MSIDADLDRLYQLPPAQFVAERNALAKRAGARADDIRALPKPTLPVWIVNQLYWREPDLYKSLVAKAEDLRATHEAVVAGRRGDLRAASRAHEDAVEAALKAALAIAGEGGTTPSDAVRQTIGTTLRGLPAGDPPGRLKHPLAPGGFRMLAALPSRGSVVPAPAPRPTTAPSKSTGRGTAPKKVDTAALKRARQAAAIAERALANADQQARREEFEAARASRDAEKAQRRVARAKESLDVAQAELEEAERDAAAAAKKRDAARSRAAAADRALAAARERHDAAQRDVRRAESG